MTQTLGDLLRARQAHDEAERKERIAAAERAEAEKLQAARAETTKMIADFFDVIKNQITEALTAGKKLPYIYLPQNHSHKIYNVIAPTARYEFSCDSPSNAGHKPWMEFKQWAETNGMKVWWDEEPYERNPGYVVPSFCRLNFKPL
jgi:hypothetical protein